MHTTHGGKLVTHYIFAKNDSSEIEEYQCMTNDD